MQIELSAGDRNFYLPTKLGLITMNGKVFSMMFLGTLGLALGSNFRMFDNTGGCDCPSKHPQQKFCDDSLVIKAIVVQIRGAESTGGNQGMSMDMVIEVSVNELFKGNETLHSENVYLHSYGMCRFDMMLSVGQEYVFSATDIYQPGYFVIQRGCNWVQKWNSLTTEQINGLYGDYYDCRLCQISKTMTQSNPLDDYSFLQRSPIDGADEPIGMCYHNQQMAFRMRTYEDCETLYSACVVRGNECLWLENREYRKCMKKRAKELKKGRKNKAKQLSPQRRPRKPKLGNRRTIFS